VLESLGSRQGDQADQPAGKAFNKEIPYSILFTRTSAVVRGESRKTGTCPLDDGADWRTTMSNDADQNHEDSGRIRPPVKDRNDAPGRHAAH
jgi:hypothetical protein